MGEILTAEDIEEPNKLFEIKFMKPAYDDQYQVEYCDVMAETAAGALKIAEFHNCFGKYFEVV